MFHSRSPAVGEVAAQLRVEPSVASDRLWAVVVVVVVVAAAAESG